LYESIFVLLSLENNCDYFLTKLQIFLIFYTQISNSKIVFKYWFKFTFVRLDLYNEFILKTLRLIINIGVNSVKHYFSTTGSRLGRPTFGSPKAVFYDCNIWATKLCNILFFWVANYQRLRTTGANFSTSKMWNQVQEHHIQHIMRTENI